MHPSLLLDLCQSHRFEMLPIHAQRDSSSDFHILPTLSLEAGFTSPVLNKTNNTFTVPTTK